MNTVRRRWLAIGLAVIAVATVGFSALRAKADTVTALADQYLALIPQLQSDLPADSETQVPSSLPWKELSRIASQFNTAIIALAQACPR